MTLVKFQPRPMLSDLFEDFFNERSIFHNNPVMRSVPAANISETAEAFRVELVAPGYKRDDLLINLEKNMLTVSSVQKEEKEDKREDENVKYYMREFGVSQFERRFRLPESVDSEKIKALYDNGVLTLTIPKKDEAKEKPARQIFIS